MLPNDLEYDVKELKEQYTQALDNYMDTLAWENLGTDERFSTHYFIDCWSVCDLLCFSTSTEQKSSKWQDKSLENPIKKSLNHLNMPHIRIFDYDWEENFFTSKPKNYLYRLSDFYSIVDYYLNIVACDSKNIRQIMWAIEGKKIQKEIDLFSLQLYSQRSEHRYRELEFKYRYINIAGSIYMTILEGFNSYFETMPPSALWLKLSDVWVMFDLYGLLKEHYPLAGVENLKAKEMEANIELSLE
jgi:hypothetical protein